MPETMNLALSKINPLKKHNTVIILDHDTKIFHVDNCRM